MVYIGSQTSQFYSKASHSIVRFTALVFDRNTVVLCKMSISDFLLGNNLCKRNHGFPQYVYYDVQHLVDWHCAVQIH